MITNQLSAMEERMSTNAILTVSLSVISGISSVEMNYRAEAFARDIDSFFDVRGLHVLIASVTSILKSRDHR